MLEQLLPLSTGHLTQATCDKISLEDDQVDVVAYGNEYGGFVYVGDPENESIYPDLNACLIFARKHGAHWIKFDRDAPENPELETYTWE